MNTRFVIAAIGSITGSSALISEGVHSLVDTGNRGLLFHGLRRGARPAIREIALADPAVVGLGVVLTMHLGPDDVLLNIETQFTEGLPAEEIHAAEHRIEARITEPYPEVSRIFIAVEALRVAAAAEPPA